jgi:hypothetical protein
MDSFSSSPSTGSQPQFSSEQFKDQLKTQLAQAYAEEFLEVIQNHFLFTIIASRYYLFFSFFFFCLIGKVLNFSGFLVVANCCIRVVFWIKIEAFLSINVNLAKA